LAIGGGGRFSRSSGIVRKQKNWRIDWEEKDQYIQEFKWKIIKVATFFAIACFE
jgi:hypothetical protein